MIISFCLECAVPGVVELEELNVIRLSLVDRSHVTTPTER